jgi:hypothetical protein
MSPSKYAQESVSNCVKHIKEKLGQHFSVPHSAPNPFPIDYSPGEDVTEELSDDEETYFQQVIGVLQWMVEVGRIDINTKVPLPSQHLALPRVGHLQAELHIMAYLRNKHNSRMVFDATAPVMDKGQFLRQDCAKEAIPPNALTPRGLGVTMRMFVDSDHVGDKVSRRSRTGFLIYLNMGLVQWLSKRQSTIETSVFGEEFVAMKHGIETCRGIRYKLRMIGVPIKGPTYVFGDNMSVIHNYSKVESELKKKCNSVCYHAVRESVAMGETLAAYISTHGNPADLMTKCLSGHKGKYRVEKVLYEIFDKHG